MSRPLAWDGRRLELAAPREEMAMLRLGGLGLSRTSSAPASGVRCTGTGCATGWTGGS